MQNANHRWQAEALPAESARGASMTTSAHGNRRIDRRATHTPDTERHDPSCRFSYRDLHPEMYRDPQIRGTYADRIKQWLKSNGPATALEISGKLGIDKSIVGNILSRGLPDIVVVGTHLPEKGAPCRKWGIKPEAHR